MTSDEETESVDELSGRDVVDASEVTSDEETVSVDELSG